MENSLRAKKKFEFATGDIAKHTEESDDQWKTVNSMVVGWIRASIQPKFDLP